MICCCCFLKKMQRYVENRENPLRFASLVSNRECNNTKRPKGLSLDLLLLFLKENAIISREQKGSPDTYISLLGLSSRFKSFQP